MQPSERWQCYKNNHYPSLKKNMRNIITSIVVLVLAITGFSSCSSSPWDDMPSAVSMFIDKYFNEGKVAEAIDIPSGFMVTIKNGAQITFNSENEWTDINGRGETLPQMLITDQLPAKVVDYLTSMELLGGVYRLQRSWHYLLIDLSDCYFTYDDHTDSITYPEVAGK